MYENFSKIYDYFMESCDYDLWVKEIYSILENYGISSGKLLDIGCGTGEMGMRFSEKFSYSGLDLSEEMLRLAHKKLKNKGVQLYHGDMTNFVVPERQDVAVALFDTINHLVSVEEMISHLLSVKDALTSNGVYIFDVIDREFMDKMFPGGIFFDDRKKITVIWEHTLEEGIDYIDATYFIKNKQGSYDRLTEYYEKKIFTQEELKECIEKSGMKLLDIIKNDNIAGTRYLYVVSSNEKN